MTMGAWLNNHLYNLHHTLPVNVTTGFMDVLPDTITTLGHVLNVHA